MAFTTFAYVFFFLLQYFLSSLPIHYNIINLWTGYTSFCLLRSFHFHLLAADHHRARSGRQDIPFPCFCSSRTLAGTEVRILTPGAISCVPLPINSVRLSPRIPVTDYRIIRFYFHPLKNNHAFCLHPALYGYGICQHSNRFPVPW